MTAELWVSLGGMLISAAVAIIVARMNKENAANKKAAEEERERTERRAQRRERESRLSMEMMAASIELGDVTAIAVSGGLINGNVEAARQKARVARDAYEAFLRDEAAHQVAKQ